MARRGVSGARVLTLTRPSPSQDERRSREGDLCAKLCGKKGRESEWMGKKEKREFEASEKKKKTFDRRGCMYS